MQYDKTNFAVFSNGYIFWITILIWVRSNFNITLNVFGANWIADSSNCDKNATRRHFFLSEFRKTFSSGVHQIVVRYVLQHTIRDIFTLMLQISDNRKFIIGKENLMIESEVKKIRKAISGSATFPRGICVCISVLDGNTFIDNFL